MVAENGACSEGPSFVIERIVEYCRPKDSERPLALRSLRRVALKTTCVP